MIRWITAQTLINSYETQFFLNSHDQFLVVGILFFAL